MPVIGHGRYRRQPIFLEDFNAAILAFINQGLPNAAFDAGGGESLTMNAIVDTISLALGKSVRKLHLPKKLFVQMARFHRDFDPSLLEASDEDELADPSALSAASGVQFRSFAQGVHALL